MPSLAVTFPAGSQGPWESTSPVQGESGEALRAHPSCALAAPWLSQSDAPSQDPKPTGHLKSWEVWVPRQQQLGSIAGRTDGP